MAIKLYLDEDAMARALAVALRERGVDVITTQEEGMVGSTDEQQLRYATSQGRTLYSFNVGDFYQLHTRFLENGETHGGIILAPQGRYSIGEQLRRLLRLVAARPAEEMTGQCEFLSSWN